MIYDHQNSAHFKYSKNSALSILQHVFVRFLCVHKVLEVKMTAVFLGYYFALCVR